MYIHRAAEETVRKLSGMFGAVLVTGPRQVGKTTLLQQLAEKDRRYLTLDDPDLRQLARRDPSLFMQSFPPPVIIDEIQYAPELLPYVKIHVDRTHQAGAFWLTGSQQFHMMKNVSESLAGRVGIIRLQGLSNTEINRYPSEPFLPERDGLLRRLEAAPPMTPAAVFTRIWQGSMPAVNTGQVEWQSFYSAYVSTYLQRDIRDLTQVADELSFYNFMTVAAARTARPIVYEEIAKECGISAPTAKKWVLILISSGIAALVQPFYNNILKRVTKMPLLHFLDSGLCAYLLKWNSPETLERGAMSGAFFESYVFAEVYKSWLNSGLEPPLYYYRDKDGREIDLLIHQSGRLHPIEIKKTASPERSMLRHFRTLAPLAVSEPSGDSAAWAPGTGAVVCLIDKLLPADEANWFVPAWLV